MDEWLLLQEGIWVYIMLFLLLMGGAIGLPIPEDIPLILAGVLVQAGKAELQWVALVCYGSIILGDVIIYAVGNKFGPALFQKPFLKRRLSSSKLRKVRLSLERRSVPMIFIARHLFYFRTATFLTCGAVKMNFTRFLIADCVAALVSMPMMIGLGYLAAEHYDTVFHVIKKAKYLTLAVFIIAALAAFLYYKRKQRRSESDADLEPQS